MVEQFALGASSGKFFLITAFGLIAGGVAFWYAWTNLVRKRVMEDMPTAKLRSAHQGYIELQGRAELMDGAPIKSFSRIISFCSTPSQLNVDVAGLWKHS